MSLTDRWVRDGLKIHLCPGFQMFLRQTSPLKQEEGRDEILQRVKCITVLPDSAVGASDHHQGIDHFTATEREVQLLESLIRKRVKSERVRVMLIMRGSSWSKPRQQLCCKANAASCYPLN